jgi:hypothetical protein
MPECVNKYCVGHSIVLYNIKDKRQRFIQSAEIAESITAFTSGSGKRYYLSTFFQLSILFNTKKKLIFPHFTDLQLLQKKVNLLLYMSLTYGI